MTNPTAALHFGSRLDVAVRSSAGVGPGARSENQDNFLVVDSGGLAIFLQDEQQREQRLHGWPPGHVRLAVLDGMGGHGQGREAAEAVVAGLLTIPACETLGELNRHLEALHHTLQQHFGADCPDGRRPGTTLTLLELRPGKAALLYHVGDSRLYEIKQDRVFPLTIDHVPATAYAMEGVMGEDEWWRQVHGEHRSQISQAFILGNAFTNPAELSDPLYALSPLNLPPFLYHLPDRRALELDVNAAYVMATDGFWACDDPPDFVMRWPELFSRCGSARDMCDALFAEMAERPPPGIHPDNLSAIVLRPRSGDETALPGGPL